MIKMGTSKRPFAATTELKRSSQNRTERTSAQEEIRDKKRAAIIYCFDLKRYSTATDDVEEGRS